MSNKNMINDDHISPMMTVGEVARFLGLHINTVRRWSERGILKPYYIGKRRDQRFVREDITHFLHELNKNKGDERKVKLSWR